MERVKVVSNKLLSIMKIGKRRFYPGGKLNKKLTAVSGSVILLVVGSVIGVIASLPSQKPVALTDTSHKATSTTGVLGVTGSTPTATSANNSSTSNSQTAQSGSGSTSSTSASNTTNTGVIPGGVPKLKQGTLNISPSDVTYDINNPGAATKMSISASDGTAINMPGGDGIVYGGPTIPPSSQTVWTMHFDGVGKPVGTYTVNVAAMSTDRNKYTRYSANITVHVITGADFSVTPDVTQVTDPGGAPVTINFHFATTSSVVPGMQLTSIRSDNTLSSCTPYGMSNTTVTLPDWKFTCLPPGGSNNTYDLQFTFSTASTTKVVHVQLIVP